MSLTVAYPSWLKPEIIPGLPFRWYGLMYLIAFGIAYLLFRKQVRERSYPLNDDQISSLFFWIILGLLIGARVFATIVYDTSGIYLQKPYLVFWPFDGNRFVGLQGMSYHGGLLGATVALIIYCVLRRIDVRDVGDMLATAVPLGYTFGRLGNFINGELYGRVTAAPWGMIFPHAERFSTRLDWVRSIAEKTGIPLTDPSGMVNLPRHPSQLYEALFEGVFLWLVLWLWRKKRPYKGFMIGLYVVGYGLIRFVIEYFREPDADLGYRIELVKTGIPPALFSSPFNFSTGQILCFLMILGGILWLIIAARLPQGKEPAGASVQYTGTIAKGSEKKKEGRKLRKKLR